MVAANVPPAVPDAVAEAIDRLAIAIAERGAKLEDYSIQTEGLLQGNYDSWRQAYINLGLPTFSGAPDDWLRFYRAYKETSGYFSVDENCKRVYNNLRGPALEFAERLVNADSTADHILNSIEKHFNLSVTVASKLLESIDQLEPLHDRSRNDEFVVFATQVDHIVSALSNLSESFYVYDPRLAMKVINRLNKQYRERWRTYSVTAPDLPILEKVSKFLNEEVTKVCSLSSAEEQPPSPVDRPEVDAELEELWTVARKQLELLPRLESSAPAHQVALFSAILKKVVCMVSAKNQWVLADEQVFNKVVDRLNPFYTGRWYDYAARHHTDAQPELVTLAWFITDEAARVSTRSAPASRCHKLKVKPSVPKPGWCLCCRGTHWTPKCRALLRMSSVERLRWARRSGVCLQCLGRHRGRRCRAPRCCEPRCRRPHHILLHIQSLL